MTRMKANHLEVVILKIRVVEEIDTARRIRAIVIGLVFLLNMSMEMASVDVIISIVSYDLQNQCSLVT